MEVKSVYLDLIEGKKNWNVWRLESEAFKDPIEIKIGYDNHELKEFRDGVDEHRLLLKKLWESIVWRSDKILDNEKRIKEVNQLIWLSEKSIQMVSEKQSESKEEINSLYKEIADLKQTVEMQSGTILHLQEQMKRISQKLMEQPTVIHDKWFISWHEPAWLWMVELKDGNYLMVAKYVVGEHNEYVENKDDIVIEKIYVDWGHYVPFYKLEWGTELDLPTATIYYDLVFIPL